MLKDLIIKNRSYRRFDPTVHVTMNELSEMCEAARLSGYGMNIQSTKYILINDSKTCKLITENCVWAGYLTDWQGPAENEQPSAYIMLLFDKTLKKQSQHSEGIAAQSILLTAVDMGYGGCIIGSCKRQALMEALAIDAERYEIAFVIALGKPAETVILEESADDIKYYRDENGCHHVPKRPLNELIIRKIGE